MSQESDAGSESDSLQPGEEASHKGGRGSKSRELREVGTSPDIRFSVSEQEASKLIGLSKSTLRAWRSQGRGPAYCRLGRRIVYPLKGLEQFLERNLGEVNSR